MCSSLGIGSVRQINCHPLDDVGAGLVGNGVKLGEQPVCDFHSSVRDVPRFRPTQFFEEFDDGVVYAGRAVRVNAGENAD
jgi:hypothetical protein